MSCDTISAMLNELGPIVRTVPIDQTRLRRFLDKYNLNVSQSSINNIGICSSVVGNIADNIITVPRECVTNVERACRLEEERGANYAECFRRFRPSIRNVTQKNISNIEQNCNIVSLLNDGAVERNTQLALTLKLLLGNQKVSCEEGVDNSFSFLNRDERSVDVINNCLNESFLMQSNNLSVCYADGVFQENIANVIQTCSIESEVQSGTPISIGRNPTFNPPSRGRIPSLSPSPSPSPNRIIKFNPNQYRNGGDSGGGSGSGGSNNTMIMIIIAVVFLLLVCSSFFVFMNMN
jgi:hypothetical protein